MERDEQTMVHDAIATILRKSMPDQVVPTLIAQGWSNMRDADEAYVLGTLFEVAGSTATNAPLLDLVVPHRPVLPFPGTAQPARAEHDRLEIEGIVLGGRADIVLVCTDAGGSYVPGDAVEFRPVDGFDPGLGAAVVSGSVAVADSEQAPELGWAPTRTLLQRCLAHELVGIAESTTELVHEYAMTREQFGRPLGSWQTVQHRLADVHVELAGARSALAAAWADDEELITLAAKRQAGLAALSAVTHAQQIFGAIGFTAEHGLHHRVRRAYLLDAVLGSADELAIEIGAALVARGGMVRAHVGL